MLSVKHNMVRSSTKVITVLALVTIAIFSYKAHYSKVCKVNSMLITAIKAGNLDSVRIALRNGADANCLDEESRIDENPVPLLLYRIGEHSSISPPSALEVASKKGDTAIVRLLLDAGALINVNSFASTPLTEAVSYNNCDVVQLLLKNGADVNLCGVWMGCPLAIAKSTNDSRMLLILKQAGTTK